MPFDGKSHPVWASGNRLAEVLPQQYQQRYPEDFCEAAGTPPPAPTTLYDKLPASDQANVYGCWSVLEKMVAGTSVSAYTAEKTGVVTTPIGFSGDFVDTASLLTFAGTGDASCRQLNEQLGTGRNFLQTTFANQPRLVNAGTLEQTLIGACMINPSGGSRRMQGSFALTGSPALTYIYVFSVISISSLGSGMVAMGASSPSSLDVIASAYDSTSGSKDVSMRYVGAFDSKTNGVVDTLTLFLRIDSRAASALSDACSVSLKGNVLSTSSTTSPAQAISLPGSGGVTKLYTTDNTNFVRGRFNSLMILNGQLSASGLAAVKAHYTGLGITGIV